MLSEIPLLIGVAILLLVGVALVVDAGEDHQYRPMHYICRSIDHAKSTSSRLRTVVTSGGVSRKGRSSK